MTATTSPPVAPAPAEAPPPLEHTSFSYKPALDGIRAVAVLAVVAYHFGAGWARGGFLGVDMFFVLSGYLITSLLLVEWGRSDTIRFRAFWARRARRLLPALLLVLVAIAIWGRLMMGSDQWSTLRADSLWTLFYGANWHFIASGQSYFTPEPSMLRHAWSLAIEEQFYAVWPLIVFACLRLARGRHRLLVAVSAVGIAGSLYALASTFTEGADPSRPYYGTDARASQLLVGALLAVLLVHWAPSARGARAALQGLGVLAALVITWMFWAARDQGAALYRGGFLAFAACTAVLIAAVVQPTRNPLRAGLSLPPVRWIGQVSYGVYLWHWPVAVALSPSRVRGWGWGLSGWELATVRLACTFAIAACSYYLLELPIRHRRFRRRFTPRILLPAGVGLTAAAILLATAGATKSTLAQAPGTEIRTQASVPVRPPGTTPDRVAVPSRRMLLLGDSVAASLGDALAAAAAADGVTFQAITRLGCGMTTGIALDEKGKPISWSPDCARGTAAYQEGALEEVSPDTVLWLSTWELADYEVDGVRLRYGTRAWDSWFLSQLEAVHQRVAAHGARLVLVTIPPRAPNPLIPVENEETKRAEHLNDLFARFAGRHDDVAVVDLGALVCPGGPPCPTSVDGIALRPRDGGHFEADGAAWVAPRLLDEVYEALRALGTGTTSTTVAR